MKWIKNWATLILHKIKEDHVSEHASTSAFFTLMSAAPFLMLVLALLQYVPLDEGLLLESYEELLPESAIVFLEIIIEELNTKASTVLLSASVLFLLWSAGKGILAMTEGLNEIYHMKETRNYAFLRLEAILHTILFAILIILVLFLIVFWNDLYAGLVQLLPFLDQWFPFLIVLVRTGITFGVLFLFFLFFYDILPNGTNPKWRRQFPGTIFSSISWIVCSYIFSYYVDHSDNLAFVYGSLTDMIAIMLWLYICMFLFFIGGELNVIFYPRDYDIPLETLRPNFKAKQ